MPRPDWPTAAPFVPDTTAVDALRSAATGCRGCPLWEPATQVVFGRAFRVTQSRGTVLDWPAPGGPLALATVHPSSVLRAGDRRDEAYAGLVSDLRVVAGAVPSR